MKNKLPWIFLAAIHIAFFSYALQGGNSLLKDSEEYLQQAKNILSNSSWYCGDLHSTFKEELVSQRPPGYGMLLALLQITSTSTIVLFLLQTLLSIFNCWLAYRILRVVINKEINPYLFLLPLLFFPTQFIYANMLMAEMLFQTFMMLALYYGVNYLKYDKIISLWKFQLMITLSFLVKPFTVLLPVLLFPLLLIYIARMRKNKISAVTFLLPIVFIIAIINYNYSRTGVKEYSSISRKLMINYNVYALEVKLKGAEVTYHEIDSVEKSVSFLSYPEKAKTIDNFCSDIIIQHPLQYISLHFYGAWRFFIEPCNWEINHFFNFGKPDALNNVSNSENTGSTIFKNEKTPYVIYTISSVLVNFALLLTFIISLFYKRVDLKYRIFIAAIVLYFAFLTGPSASSRFKLPVFPVLLISFGLFVNNVNEIAEAQIKSRD